MSEIYLIVGAIAFWLCATGGFLTALVFMADIVYKKGTKLKQINDFIRWRNKKREKKLRAKKLSKQELTHE